MHVTITLSKWPYDEFGWPYDSFMALSHPQCSRFTKVTIDRNRSDIATITNILWAYLHKATPSHLAAIKYVIKYFKGSTNMGMSFSTKSREKRHAFIKFSVNPSKIVSFIDANWGAQDVSIPKLHPRDVLLKLFKSRLPSGIIIWLGGCFTLVFTTNNYSSRFHGNRNIYHRWKL